MKKVISNFLPTLVAIAMVLGVAGIANVFAASEGTVVIDTINGNPPGGTCIPGAITVTGHGVTGSNGGPYNLDIEWGDGFITTVSLPSGGNDPFTFSETHTPTQVTTTFGVFLYHSQRSGNDAHVDITTFCAAPPTTAVLTVKKHVVNDDAGNASASDFTLHVKDSGNSDVADGGNGVGSPTSGSETGKDFIITPNGGAYTVSEESLAGYTQTSSVGDCSATLVAGNNYVCTITNDDNEPAPVENTLELCTDGQDNDNDDLVDLADPDCAAFVPKLTVTKVVNNDAGGTMVATDFALFVDGNAVTTGVQGSFSVGAHVVSETSVANYNGVISGDCALNGSVSLAAGDTKSCTITNTFVPTPVENTLELCTDEQDNDGDQLIDLADPDCAAFMPKLTVTKVVEGGDLVASSVALFVDGNSVTTGVQNTFSAGNHTVSETPVANYTGVISGDCAVNGSVSLAAGDAKSCTITNTFVPPPSSDLSLTKTVNGEASVSVDSGTNVTFAVTITNNGPDDAADVTVNDLLPAGFTFVSDDGALPTSYDETTGVWTLGILANDTSATLHIVATATGSGGATLTNTATTSLASDPNSENNSDSASVTINTPPCTENCTPSTDLGISKTVNDNSVNKDQEITYTLTVTNHGPDTATNVEANDDLPSGVSFVSANASQGTYDQNTGIWNIGTLTNGQAVTLQIVVKVTVSSGSVTNSANVFLNQENDTDSNIANDSDSEQVTVRRRGGSSGGGGHVSTPAPAVLGASTSALCNWDVNTYMRRGYRNDIAQVKIMQNDLLNGYMHSGLVVDGLFGPLTEAAVKAFQVAKADKILAPWHLTAPTGIFYKTTLVEAKNTICPQNPLPIPTDLIPWSANPAQVPPKI